MNRRLFAIVVLALAIFSTLGLDRQIASAQAADFIAVGSNCSSTVNVTGFLNYDGTGWVELYVGGVWVGGTSVGYGAFSLSFNVSIVPPTQIVAQLWNGQESMVAEASMNCDGSTGFLPECATAVHKIGTVAISPAQSQPAYDAPNGNRVLIDGKPVMLPGSPVTGREFTVIDKKTVGGKLWLGLWIGACVPVWVPASGVTLLTAIS
jgi:hypothetical protein